MTQCPACYRPCDQSTPSRLDNETQLCGTCSEMESRFVVKGNYNPHQLRRLAWILMGQVPETVGMAKHFRRIGT